MHIFLRYSFRIIRTEHNYTRQEILSIEPCGQLLLQGLAKSSKKVSDYLLEL